MARSKTLRFRSAGTPRCITGSVWPGGGAVIQVTQGWDVHGVKFVKIGQVKFQTKNKEGRCEFGRSWDVKWREIREGGSGSSLPWGRYIRIWYLAILGSG